MKTSVSGNPDAGNYEKKGFGKIDDNPQFSFGKSGRPEALRRGPPGPGEYEVRPKIGSGVPCFSMPGRRKDLRPKAGVDAPSCDKYSPSKSYVVPNERAFSVGK